MPNWCQGTLKVRGEYDGLKVFLENALEECAYVGEPPKGLLLEVAETPEYADITLRRMARLKDTSRGFVEEDTDILLEKKAGKQIIFLAAQFEQGMQFERDIEIVQGFIVLDSTKKYQDYAWMCPCPTVGG